MTSRKVEYFWGILRIFLGIIFLWAFVDKLIGLGYATCNTEEGIQVLCEKAWISGGSPTYGFLKFATKGPFALYFQSLAGNPLVDSLFMLGLLGVGLALILGVFTRIASVSGALMLFLMWLAVLPPTNNPFLDDHIIYLILMFGFIIVRAGRYLGLGNWWHKTSLVKKHPWLE